MALALLGTTGAALADDAPTTTYKFGGYVKLDADGAVTTTQAE